MIKVGGGRLEQCEEIGETLLAHGISPQIRDDAVWVRAEDEERAKEILGWDDTPPELEPPPTPFHPCPKCGTPDPIWNGKWKALAVLALIAILIGTMLAQPPHFAVWSIATFVLLLIALGTIPEWKCGRCGHRWTTEPEAAE